MKEEFGNPRNDELRKIWYAVRVIRAMKLRRKFRGGSAIQILLNYFQENLYIYKIYRPFKLSVCVCIYILVYIYTYIHTYIYTHTHTHIYIYIYIYVSLPCKN